MSNLPDDLTDFLRGLGQRFDPEVAKATRAFTIPFHDMDKIAALSVQRDVAYGPDERHRLDIYGAGESGQRKPVAIFVHGGAFVGGDKSAPDGAPFYQNVAVWAQRYDLALIAMTYRLAPAHGWPAGAEDIASAIGWLHANGADFGLDADRAILIGQSAGAAHVSGYLAMPELHNAPGIGLIGAALLSGLYDMVTAADNPPKFAYYGKDPSVYAQRSSLPGLVEHCRIPLALGVCEYDPADFQRQFALLAKALFDRDQRLAHLVYQAGHNHLSSTFLLGSDVDTLGPPLGSFVADVLRAASAEEQK